MELRGGRKVKIKYDYDRRTYVAEDGTDFDGHFVRWDFSYTSETYLKESELSGDEYRKGGMIRYFKDGVQVYEDFCRDPYHASILVTQTLPKLQQVDWDKVKEGKKLYYENTPCKIGSVFMDQGAFMVEVDGADRFPKKPYDIEEGDMEDYEDPKRLKVDVLSTGIWWWRK